MTRHSWRSYSRGFNEPGSIEKKQASQNPSEKHELIVIAGPTASGKTAAAVELCKMIGGEVISADPMQIYRGMDILSAKPTPQEMAGVRTTKRSQCAKSNRPKAIEPESIGEARADRRRRTYRLRQDCRGWGVSDKPDLIALAGPTASGKTAADGEFWISTS